MIRSRYSSTDRSWSFASIRIARIGPSKLPFGPLTLAAPITARTSATQLISSLVGLFGALTIFRLVLRATEKSRAAVVLLASGATDHTATIWDVATATRWKLFSSGSCSCRC